MKATLHLINAGLLGLGAGQFGIIANDRFSAGQPYDFEFIAVWACIVAAIANLIYAVKE